MPVRHTPVRYTPVRYRYMRYTVVKYTAMRWIHVLALGVHRLPFVSSGPASSSSLL
jgi:hypothetical protein